MKSSIAAPSRRNSGLDATSNSAVGLGLADDARDLAAGADRHGRLGDDHGVAADRVGDLGGGGIDVGQVGMAVAAPGRRADGDEHRVGVAHRLAEIGGEGEPAGRACCRRPACRGRARRSASRPCAGGRSCPRPCRRRPRRGRTGRSRRRTPVRHSPSRSWQCASLQPFSRRSSSARVSAAVSARCERDGDVRLEETQPVAAIVAPAGVAQSHGTACRRSSWRARR